MRRYMMARPGWEARRAEQRRALAEFAAALCLVIAAVAFLVIAWASQP